LALAGKAHAFLNGRSFVIPEDIRAVANDVMRHRIGLTFEAEAEQLSSVDIIQKIISKVEVP
jgi:MoxR-like ATPase